MYVSDPHSLLISLITYRCVFVFKLSQELGEYIIKRMIITIDAIVACNGLAEHVDKECLDGLE